MPWDTRFTTRRLFFVIAAFALSFATVPGRQESSSPSWDAFLLSLISFLAVYGLGQQTKDLWHLRRSSPDGPGYRFAIWLAVSWRSIIIAALIAIYTLTLFVNRGIVALPSPTTDYVLSSHGDLFPELTWSFLVFLILATVPGALPARPGQFALPNARRALGCIVACILVAVVLCQSTIVYFLVHLATAGIEVHQPLHVQRRGTFPQHAQEGFAFFWAACVAAACAAFNLLALQGVASAARRGARWRWPLLIALVSGLVATTGYSIWYIYRGLPRVSPDMAAVNMRPNGAEAVFLLGAVLTFAFILARRLSVDSTAQMAGGLPWRRPTGYLHECHATPLMVLALAIYELAFLHDPLRGYLYYDFFDGVRGLVLFGSFAGLMGAVGRALNWLPTFLWLAMGLLAVRLLFFRKDVGRAREESALQTISPVRLSVFFVLAAWLIVSGLFTLAAFSFAWWFGPWFG